MSVAIHWIRITSLSVKLSTDTNLTYSPTCTLSTLSATMLSLSSSLAFSVVSCRRPIKLILPLFWSFPPFLKDNISTSISVLMIYTQIAWYGGSYIVECCIHIVLVVKLLTTGQTCSQWTCTLYSCTLHNTRHHMAQPTHTNPNSWFTLNSVPSLNSRAILTSGSQMRTCLLILG